MFPTIISDIAVRPATEKLALFVKSIDCHSYHAILFQVTQYTPGIHPHLVQLTNCSMMLAFLVNRESERGAGKEYTDHRTSIDIFITLARSGFLRPTTVDDDPGIRN